MSKSKKGDKRVIPWMSARVDCVEGRFIQVGNSLLLSGTVQKLSNSAFKVYFCMAMQSGGTPRFTLSEKEAKKYGIPRNTLGRAVKELRDAGFIRFRSGKNTREKNQYEFDYSWKTEKNYPPNVNFGSPKSGQADSRFCPNMGQSGEETGTDCPQSEVTSEK